MSGTADWIGRSLGERTVSYEARDAILFALAVGAAPDDLDLVYEKQLRVLPTFGLTIAQWAPDTLAEAGAFDNTSVHGSQTLTVHAPLPASGSLELRARVGDIWDKGAAAIFNVIVESEYFDATWSLFAPGAGGFGGDRGPGRPTGSEDAPDETITVPTALNQAALYRLTGDVHDIHIDPAASARIGQPRPILQGLATLATVAVPLGYAAGSHPADLTRLEGRFTGMVIPGDELSVRRWADGRFDVTHDGATVISDGLAVFK